MRVKLLVSLLVAAAVVSCASCAHEDRRSGAAVRVPEPRTSGTLPAGPAQYLVADPGPRASVVAVALGPGGGVGLVVDRARIVTGRGEPRVSADAPDQALLGAIRMPGRFGGGFLFWTDNALYRADTFDGLLKPLTRLPGTIQVLSFAPKFLLVRTNTGERWALSPMTGDRAAIEPLGVVDEEGLDDGRALAFNDQGAAFSSTDGGANWSDVTAHVRSSPTRVAVVDDEVWLFESSGAAHRLEPDGRLSYFDKQPPEPPVELRSKDPRWHGAEPPLREAFLGGAAIEDGVALVVSEGDLVRVDVHTGEILGVASGKLPPDARCHAIPTQGDVLFACLTKNRGYPASQGAFQGAFVVSHTLGDEAPTIEQTFDGLAIFFASDDGGLAYGGTCAGVAQGNAALRVACVRQPGGSWLEYDLSAIGVDAGPGDVMVSRWVPRADGRAVAFVADPSPGIYDPRTGTFLALSPDARPTLIQGLAYVPGRHLKRSSPTEGSFVDFSWSFTGSGTLRGWQTQGGVVEITDDAKVTRSPFAFDVVASGPFGVGRTQDGRLFQSIDHGANWVEVATPPSGGASIDLRSCTSAGCDLGGFYRVGWAARPPRAETPQAPVRVAADVQRTRPLELSCRPAAPPASKILPRSDHSPEDLGLGGVRLPINNESGDIVHLRVPIPRGIASPLHDTSTTDDNAALRALLSGYQTNRDNDVLVVQGPNKNASTLKRGLSFVPAFDPAAPVKRTSIAMSDILAVGRAAGMTQEEIFSDDMTENASVVIMTSLDPGGAGDLGVQFQRGLVAHVRAGSERVRLSMRAPQNDANLISGVTLPNDEAAFLELESTGVGHAFKIGPGGPTDLFDVSPTMTDTSFYPANPDALAVGPRGDLAILRTGSGSDPASLLDPALLLVPAMPPQALAPWSTLRLADDPACKGDPGWRATLQLVGPWVRVSTPELRVEEAPMIARVKWNEKRVCLEGLEVKLPSLTLRGRSPSASDLIGGVASWLVARGSTFSRVAVGEGYEWRQPLECTVVAKQPVAARP